MDEPTDLYFADRFDEAIEAAWDTGDAPPAPLDLFCAGIAAVRLHRYTEGLHWITDAIFRSAAYPERVEFLMYRSAIEALRLSGDHETADIFVQATLLRFPCG
jgi:hypothetical protein